MTTIEIFYTGQLRTTAKHLGSGIEIITDAPKDNQGKGESFSPTDLLASSLGSCMLTIMGIAARNHEFSMEGTRAQITKIMSSNPRKIAEVIVEFTMPDIIYTTIQKQILEKAAHTCPVALSLDPLLKQTLIFNWK